MSVFKGNKNFYEYEMGDTLTSNIINWMKYGFVEMGAFTNIKFDLPNSGYTNLKLAVDERYPNTSTKGYIYEGIGPSWVWESGISPINTTSVPFQVSGIYINNSFYPTSTSGTYSYIVDYERGRIVFNNGIPKSSTVKCEYSIRDIAVHGTDSVEFKTVIDDYTTKFNEMDDYQGSGLASILKQNRVWLPAVFVEVQDRTNAGLQLGGGEISTFGIFYHIFSDKSFSAKRIADTISNQDFKTLFIYDINNSPNSLNFNGSISSGILTYPQLAFKESPHFLTFGHIESSRTSSYPNFFDLFRSDVVQSIEIERYLDSY